MTAEDGFFTVGRDGPETHLSALGSEAPASAPRMDILKELRLRSWARENYVAPSLRDASWNPVVLDEMHLRDEEIANEELVAAATQIVPLAPVTYFLEGPHPGPPTPHFLSKPARQTTENLPEWGLFIG